MATFGNSYKAFKPKNAPKKSTKSTSNKKIGTSGSTDIGGTGSTSVKPASVSGYPVGLSPNAGQPKITARVPDPVGGGGSTLSSADTGSPGGGGSTSVPAVSGLPHQGSDPYGGWMSRFNPAEFQNQVYNDPQIVLQQMYGDQGWNTSGPLYSTLRNLNGADPQSLWMMMQGNQPGYHGGAEDYGNFLHSLYSNQMTPGGRGMDFNELLHNMTSLPDQSGLTPEKQSALWQMLTSGGAADQFKSMYGLVGDAARMGLAPSMASAFMDAMARQGDQYLSQAATSTGGQLDPYYQYFTNPGR